MSTTIDYATPGPFTDLNGVDPCALEHLPHDPIEVCRPVHTFFIHPDEADVESMSAQRRATNQVRPAADLARALLRLDPSPLTEPRNPARRVVGTCRHFATFSCALLRHRGIPARVRCGFATYFQPGLALDHWITEVQEAGRGRWRRIDSEIMDSGHLDHPEDLAPGHFLAGGEAWLAHRQGLVDARTFGVWLTESWGAGEIRGNAVRDLAALTKVETLPWDDWGRMPAAYAGETGPDYDSLLDRVSLASGADDTSGIAELSSHPDLRVPAAILAPAGTDHG